MYLLSAWQQSAFTNDPQPVSLRLTFVRVACTAATPNLSWFRFSCKHDVCTRNRVYRVVIASLLCIKRLHYVHHVSQSVKSNE